jgi:hypothetical protein
MSLVRGMTSLNTRKRKTKKKTAKQLQAEAEHESYLKRLGVKGRTKDTPSVNEIPDYSVNRVTSDKIPAHGPAKERSQYTGNEIAGITLNHKSNYEPVRRDNMQAAVDAATMRRN